MHRGRPGADGALEPVQTITLDRHVGAVAPATDGGYVLAAGTGFLHVDDAGAVRELAQPEAGPHRRADERRRLRRAGTLLGRDDGLRRVARARARSTGSSSTAAARRC